MNEDGNGGDSIGFLAMHSRAVFASLGMGVGEMKT